MAVRVILCGRANFGIIGVDYKTIFVEDANGTRSDQEHNATLINMIQFFADVRSTNDVLELINKN